LTNCRRDGELFDADRAQDRTVADLVEEDILALDKRIADIEVEIEKLYEKHNVSKEKADFIEECDSIASVLNQFIVRLRKNKVHLLQEKTFEMYRLLSSRSGLIKDITIDDKTYEVKITDRNGHEIRKSSMSAGEKEVFRHIAAVGPGADQRTEAADHHRYPVVASGQHASRQHREQLFPQRG
jgi:DNA sulfur modification protein DndD